MNGGSGITDVPAGILRKTSLVDYPGHVSCVFFLRGCNLRCPYCYNAPLVTDGGNDMKKDAGAEFLSPSGLADFLNSRRNVLPALVLSGGEPLLHPALPHIIRTAKSLGYLIKLDTNGTVPDRLARFVSDSSLRPDFVAMDIKTSPDRYGTELSGKQDLNGTEKEFFRSALAKSAEMLESEYSPDCREFRTVLVPGLVGKNDIKAISEIISDGSPWKFAAFAPGECLDSRYNGIHPYTDQETAGLVRYAASLVPGAEMR